MLLRKEVLLLLLCAAVSCGCVHNGAVRPAIAPKLPDPPPSLMRKPNYEQRIRALLFESAPKPTPK